MNRRKRTARPRLSPSQLIKGTIIRLGFGRRVKVRAAKPGPDGERKTQIHFQLIWHRVAILFAVLMLLGWISAAIGGYIFVRVARDFPEVRFVDIAFPHRWDHYRVSLGNYYIEEAKDKLEHGELDGVMQLLRVGVQQAPDNKEGRLLLGSIYYHSFNRPDLGIELLQARVDQHADDIEYLNTLISMLFNNHEDLAIEELANRLLGGSTEKTERNLVLAVAAGTAKFNRGNYEGAQEVIDTFDLMESRTGTLLQARIEWELGEPREAIALLERIRLNPGPLAEQVDELLIDYLWKNGQESRAHQLAVSQSIADSLAYAPRIRLLYIHNKREDQSREQGAIDEYFDLFEKDEPAMQALAGFSAQTGNVDLARKLYEHFRKNRFATAPAAIALMEAQVAAKEYRSALTFYNSIEESVLNWTPMQQARLKPLLVAVYFGVGETERADALLNEVIVMRRGTNPAWLMTLSGRLVEIGRISRARDLLQHIHTAEPLSQEALSQLIQVDLQLENNDAVVQNIERLLKMRKPSATILENAHNYISSDRFLFQPGREQMLQSLENALVSGRAIDL